MSLDALYKRLQAVPMLKITLCVMGGILLHRYLELPVIGLIALFVVAGLGSILYQQLTCYVVALLAAGYLLATWHATPELPPRERELKLVIDVLDDGVRRPRTHRFEARLKQWCEPTDSVWHPSSGRLWLYSDTLRVLRGGERLLVEGRIDPFAEDTASWARQLWYKGYLGRCYLNPHLDTQPLEGGSANLHLRATRALDERLQHRTDDDAALIHAMTVGNRNLISSTLRATYARSGFSHLMALSGLHVGMLFLLINLVLWWLPLFHRGHRLKHLLAIGAVWLFVAVAGFPISAIRAAVMCTLLQWALFSSAPYRSVNSWAAAALLLLLYEPNWLFDIGYQLSFLAVGAILLVGLPLCQEVRGRYRLLNYLSDAFLISIVASLATMPLAAYRFGVWPLAGIVMNPIAIFVATIVVACGVLLLLLPPLAPLLRPLTLMAADWVNQLSAKVASMTALVCDVRPSGLLVTAIYLIFLLLILLLWCRDAKKM